MLDDALAHFERQIETGKIEVPLLKMFDDAQRMQVVVEEAAVHTHDFVEFSFTRMPKRRMADVMHQRERLGQLRVRTESRRNGPCDLCDFQRVRQSVAKVVGV